MWKEDGAFVISVSPLEGVWREAARGVKKADLSDWLPQKIADKVKDEAGDQKFTGNDLKVGGKGMKGFYDEILVNEIGAYVKQWGVKVELSKDSGILKNREDSVEESLGEFQTEETARNWAKSHLKNDEWVVSQDGDSEPWIVYGQGDAHAAIWKVQITPEMAAEITERGQPAFSISRGRAEGNIEFLFKGQIDPKITYSYTPDPKEPVPVQAAKLDLMEALDDAGLLTNEAIETIEQYSNDYLDELTGEVFNGQYFSEIVEEKEEEHEDNPIEIEFFQTQMVLSEWMLAGRGEGSIETSGYALPDGRMVNMSHDGRSRDVDHREVHFPETPGGTEGMVAMMNAGMMRFDYNSGAVSLRNPPTPAQVEVIQEMAGNGSVYLDAEEAGSDGFSEARSASFEIADEMDIDAAIQKVRAFYRGRDFDGITSFSIEPKPYKERSGDEQGEPLTETEIREGIEDEPGTVGGIEIDDEAFSDDEGKSEEKATKAATQSDITSQSAERSRTSSAAA